MRELLLEESQNIAGGFGKAILDNTPYDAVKWLTGGLAGQFAYASTVAAFAAEEAAVWAVPYFAFDLGLLAVAGSAGLAVGGLGFVAGKLFTNFVLERVGD